MSGKSKLSTGKKSAKKKVVQSSMMNFVSKTKTKKPVATVKPVVAVHPFNSATHTRNSSGSGASSTSGLFRLSATKPILPFANTSAIDLTSDSSREYDEDFEVENRDPQYSECAETPKPEGPKTPSFSETPQTAMDRKSPLEESIFSPDAEDEKGSAEFSLFDDDDDDVLNSVDQYEVTPKTEAFQKKDAWADEIFGDVSPYVPLKKNLKSPLVPVTTCLKFDSEMKSDCDNDSKMKTDLICKVKTDDQEEDGDNDEEGIDFSQDKDEYEAPLNQLRKDMYTHMTQKVDGCPWDDDSKEDDLDGDDNINVTNECDDDNAGYTLDYCSPSHTPPRATLLMTCPGFEGDLHLPVKGVEKSLQVAGQIDQELFEPTPEKNTKFIRRPSKSRTSIELSDSNKLPGSSPERLDLGKLIASVKTATDLSVRLGKGRLFHKNVSRMTSDDAAKHRQNLADMVKINSDVFMEWPLDDQVEIPSQTRREVKEVWETIQTLKLKIDQYDQIQLEKSEARREMDRFAPDDDFVPPSPDKMEEDTPPFDPSPPPSPVYVSSQRVNPSSPLPAAQKTLNLPVNSAEYRIVDESGGGVIVPKAKFTFKKPGMSCNSPSVTSLASSVSTSKAEHTVARSSSFGSSFDFNNANASKDSSMSKPSIASSSTMSSRFNTSVTSSSSHLNTTGSSFGTQFIEDVSTQHDKIVHQDPMAKALANKSDKFNATVSRKRDEFGNTNMTSEIYSTQRFQSPTPSRQPSTDINSEGTFIGAARNDGKDATLSREDYPFSQEVRNVMVKKFGIRSFRPNQLQSINSAMLDNDTFVLMPTGGGKSLCYQLPAAVQGGVTVVISPLISLIHDQVTKLNAMGIAAAELTGDDYSKQSTVFTHMRSSTPGPTLIYVTPEKIAASDALNQAFKSVYNRGCLKRFVIDEAHCVSQWGHDFRPDYKKLNLLRQNFPNVPFMALTATATPRVRTDILFQLGMRTPKWFLSSFNRCNLKYEVRSKKGKTVAKEIIEEIQRSHSRQSGIVYCLSRKDCDTTADTLSAAGIKAHPYHAGLNPKERSRVQDEWIQDKVRVVCATIAFGMGIDKPDVRYVIHSVLPKSIEGYYQESGRAGRDGEPSTCILFYNYSDVHRIRKMIDMGENSSRDVKKTHYDNLYAMVGYCENITDCRRVLQLSYFGEVFDSRLCGEKRGMLCDNCVRATKSNLEHLDITELAREIVMAVQRLNAKVKWDQKNFTINHLVDIWRGAKNAKVRNSGWDQDPLFAKGSTWNITEANRVIRKLVLDGYLWEELVITRDQMASAYVKLGTKAGKLLAREVKILHQVESKKTAADRIEDSATGDNGELKEMQRECLDELKHIVFNTAKDLNPGKQISSVNVIIPVTALAEISMVLPTTREKLMDISQITEARCGPYVEVILAITEKYHNMRLEYLKRQAINKQVEDEKDDFSSFDNVSASQGSRGTSKYFRGKRGGWQGKRGGGWKGKRGSGSKRKPTSQGGTQPKRQSLDKPRGRRGGSMGSVGKGGGGGSMGMPSNNRFGAGSAGAGAWL